MKTKIVNFIRRFFSLFTVGIVSSTRQISDLQLLAYWQSLKAATLNPLNKHGAKYFSQNDEDGITLEVFRRIGLEHGVFAEFGVGDGSENNSLVLLASGWKGFWVGGEGLCFNHRSNPNHFSFHQMWIDRENILSAYNEGLSSIGESSVDLLSLDFDGNDYYLIEQLLIAGVSPKIFIVEYNSKFPPPIRWKIAYDREHAWDFDDYFGASLAEFDELFKKFGYALVCCNFSGSNAYFVKNELMSFFADVPRDLGDIFYGPQYYLLQSYGHRPSSKTIEQFIEKLGDKI